MWFLNIKGDKGKKNNEALCESYDAFNYMYIVIWVNSFH